jgi:hypothetical protein
MAARTSSPARWPSAAPKSKTCVKRSAEAMLGKTAAIMDANPDAIRSAAAQLTTARD